MGTEGSVISIEQAKNRISNLGTDEVRALTVWRLLGEDTMPVGRGYDEEPSEDLIIQLLRADDLDSTIRDAIIAGCKEVYARLWHWLVSPETCPTPGQPHEVAVRLCSVVDVTAPEGLQGPADSLLTLALDTPDVSSEVRKAAVRAAMGYSQTEDQVSLWEGVLRCPEVAAYGFNALLSIDPRSPRIERALKELWRRQVRDNWPVDTAFLMRRAAREQASDRIIGRVLSSLRADSEDSPTPQHEWNKLRAELDRRVWTRGWAQLVQPPQRSELPVLIQESCGYEYGRSHVDPQITYPEYLAESDWYIQHLALFTRPGDIDLRWVLRDTIALYFKDVLEEYRPRPALRVSERRGVVNA